MDRDQLAQDLQRLLAAHPGQDKYQLLTGLKTLGWTGLTKTDVNSVLYQRGRPFVKDDSAPPRWRLLVEERAAAVPLLVEIGPVWHLDRYRGPEPRAWQQEALDAWLEAGRRGVVEAVTGTGKTAVGILAAADAVARGRRVAVVVPGVDLLDQWYAKLTNDLTSVRIGRLGDNHWRSAIMMCSYRRFSQPVAIACYPAGAKGCSSPTKSIAAVPKSILRHSRRRLTSVWG
jgi:RNA polymerase primary sigma factor